MKVKFLKRAKVKELVSNVEKNLNLYRKGAFDFLVSDSAFHFETTLVIDEAKIGLISCDKDNFKEAENCILMYKAIKDISHYLARDERLWIYLSHTLLLSYGRERWPIPKNDEEAVKHIKTHFFCNGARGIERDNAASRLWWQASLCSRVSGLSLVDALTCFLHATDVRANIIERPTTSQNVNVFSVLLKRFHASYKSDKMLYQRQIYRPLMKQLNLIGGVKLFAALPEPEIAKILDQCIAGIG